MTSSHSASPTNTDPRRLGFIPAAIRAAVAPRTPGAARRTGLVGQSIFREQSIFWLLIAGLAWAPLWHGGNEAVVWGVNAVLFPGLAALYEAGLLLRGKPHPIGLRHVLLPAVLFLWLVLWIGAQGAAAPFAAAANPVWKLAEEAVGAPLAGSISVNRDLTAAALLRLITAASVFWLALQLCRHPGRARALVGAIALIGAAYAAYGLIAAKAGWGRLPDMTQGGAVSATFINPDSYAAFAGIGFIATAGLFFRLCRRYGAGTGGGLRQQIAALIEMSGRGGAPVLAGGFTILTALLLTGSRGGIAATGLAVAAFAALARYGRTGRRPGAWSAPIFGIALVGGTALLFGTALVAKVADVGVVDANRLAVYRLTWQSIVDRPWLGWGYGTFVDVFPMYRDGSVGGSGTWSQAHNTYLEALQGLGIVFGPIFIVLVALLVLRCFGGVKNRREDAMAPSVAVAAALLAGAHALVDFSLQMQAVALTVAALLGAGVAQAERARVPLDDGAADPVRGAGPRRTPTGGGWRKVLTALTVLALCGYAMATGYDLAAATARAQDVDAMRPDVPGAIRGGSGKTARRWLGVPGFGRSAFDLPLAQIASIDAETGAQRASDLTALVAARPLSPQAWLALAEFRLVARERPASVLAPLRLSWVTGPNEGSARWQRGILGVALWDFLSAGARERTARDVAGAVRDGRVTGSQEIAAARIFAAKSAEMRAQIRALLEKQGVPDGDLARIGLPAG